MAISTLVFALIIAYGFGSIPSGLFVARKLSEVDIRTVGSGNIGATNIYRSFGWKWAALVFAGDAVKGLIPTIVARGMLDSYWGVALAALVAVCGHVFNPWLKFKGGKGVSTAFGAAFALSPLSALVALAVWGGVVYRTRIVSLASLIAAAVLPFAILFISWGKIYQLQFAAGALAMSLLVAWAHRENIGRLRAGEEKPVTEEKR